MCVFLGRSERDCSKRLLESGVCGVLRETGEQQQLQERREAGVTRESMGERERERENSWSKECSIRHKGMLSGRMRGAGSSPPIPSSSVSVCGCQSVGATATQQPPGHTQAHIFERRVTASAVNRRRRLSRPCVVLLLDSTDTCGPPLAPCQHTSSPLPPPGNYTNGRTSTAETRVQRHECLTADRQENHISGNTCFQWSCINGRGVCLAF